MAENRVSVKRIEVGQTIRHTVSRKDFVVVSIEITPNGKYYTFRGTDVATGEQVACSVRDIAKMVIR